MELGKQLPAEKGQNFCQAKEIAELSQIKASKTVKTKLSKKFQQTAADFELNSF